MVLSAAPFTELHWDAFSSVISRYSAEHILWERSGLFEETWFLLILV